LSYQEKQRKPSSKLKKKVEKKKAEKLQRTRGSDDEGEFFVAEQVFFIVDYGYILL